MNKTNLFWHSIASICMNHAELIKKIGARSPYQNIKHDDGTAYMDRWWLMPKFLLGKDENGNAHPYSWCPLLIRLHHIHTSDYDRDLHDHPSDYRTILIDGSYIEQNIYGGCRAFYTGETRKARAENFHRIVEVTPDGVWTIFITFKKRNEWGFIVNGYKISWKEYLEKNKRKYLNNLRKAVLTKEKK